MIGYITVSVDEFEKNMSCKEKELTELIPAYKKIDAAVCIVSSNEYAPFAGVVVKSIVNNASLGNNYDIVILSDDMSVSNIRRIESIAEDYDNVSVRIFDISQYTKGHNFYTWAHFTKNTYYRLLTPDIFTNYEKVIYLDSDVIVNKDIAELYNEDITGYNMAAAYDTHVVSYCTRIPPLEQKKYNEEILHMENPEEYFQCGVSLYNISEIKNNYPKGYLISQAEEKQLRWLDQDLVNMLFYGKIKKIKNNWNVMVSNIPGDLDEYHLPEDLKNEYFEARKNPYIVHYAGHAIPCYTKVPDLYEYFWEYARQTCFYEIILQRMIPSTISEVVSLETRLKDWDIVLLQHNIMYEHYENRFHKKIIRKIVKIVDIILPKGTKRRDMSRNIVKRMLHQKN
jgi:lipopolysaccharide biosynthesis glycosyltransferase